MVDGTWRKIVGDSSPSSRERMKTRQETEHDGRITTQEMAAFYHTYCGLLGTFCISSHIQIIGTKSKMSIDHINDIEPN